MIKPALLNRSLWDLQALLEMEEEALRTESKLQHQRDRELRLRREAQRQRWLDWGKHWVDEHSQQLAVDGLVALTPPLTPQSLPDPDHWHPHEESLPPLLPQRVDQLRRSLSTVPS